MRNDPMDTKREVIIRYQLTDERMVFYGIDFRSEDAMGFDPYDSLMFVPLSYHIKVAGGCSKHGLEDCISWGDQLLIKAPHFDIDINDDDTKDADGFALYFCKRISLEDRLKLFEAVKLEVTQLYDASTIYAHLPDDEKADEGYDPNDDCTVIFVNETPQ